MDAMYEPHLNNHHYHNGDAQESSSLLEELDKLAPIQSFDAFPKVQSTYVSQSRQGGILTAIVSLLCFILVLNDLGDYLYGPPDYAFHVDHGLERELQLNVDLTVAMPCHFLTIDLRDAVGDRLHLSDDFVKDGTTFTVGKASSMKLVSPTNPSASEIISSARRRTPNQRGSFGGIRRLFSAPPKAQHSSFRPTDIVPDGPACRIYGSVNVKKVTSNLHVTTLGHGYMSMEHTDHSLMNLSHIVHEFSFGPFFPAISQPLDLSMEITEQPFTIFQYFLRVVPTTYIDSSRRRLVTSQYAVTDYSRSFEHGGGIPGIFFKYDLEAMALTIRERSTSFYQFFLRLLGAIGGVWTVAAFGMRVMHRAQREVKKLARTDSNFGPSSPGLYNSYGATTISPLAARGPTFRASRDANGAPYVRRKQMSRLLAEIILAPAVDSTFDLAFAQSPKMSETMQPRAFKDRPYIDPNPLPSSVPPVDEIGTTSAPLKSASFFIGEHCKAINDDFMLCKQENPDPAYCLKEGRKVTRCASEVLAKMRESCLQSFDAHWQCLEQNNQYFHACRSTEKELNACVFTKLNLSKRIPDTPAGFEQIHEKKKPLYSAIQK